MPTWIIIALSLVASIFLREQSQLQRIRKQWNARLCASSLSNMQLWLCSRALLPLMIMKWLIEDWLFPTISLPVGFLIIIFVAYTALHCLVFLFSFAAYDAITERKKNSKKN